MSRVIRGVAALAVLALILVGAPWLLARLGHLDAATRIDWGHLLTAPDNGDLLLLVLTVIGWLAWGHVSLTLVSEVVGVLTRHRVRLRVPGSQWLRPIAAALVTALVGLVIAQAVHSSARGPGDSGSSAQAAGDSRSVRVAPDSQQPPAAAGPPATSSAAPVAPGAAPQQTSDPRQPAQSAPVPADQEDSHTDVRAVYLVQPGDDLWTLAVTLYGEGLDWHALAAANDLEADDPLYPGTVLTVPRLSQAEVSRRTGQGTIDTSDRPIVVRPGDTLARLARVHLGSGSSWPALQQANASLILDPDHLEPGWVLHLPPRIASTARKPQPPPGHADPAPTTVPPPTGGLPAPAHAGTSDAAGNPASPGTAASAADLADAAAPGAAASTGADGGHVAPGPAATGMSQQASDDPAVTDDLGIARGIVGGLAASVLLGVGLGLARRRRGQLWARPLGRRFPGPDPSARVFHQAVQRLGVSAAAHPEPPSPTTVVVGELDDPLGASGAAVTAHLDLLGSLRVLGPNQFALAAAGGIATSLSCAPWSEGTGVLIVSPELRWLEGLDNPSLTLVTDLDEGLARLRRDLALDATPTDPGTAAQQVAIVDLTRLLPGERIRLIGRYEQLLAPPTQTVVVWICGEGQPPMADPSSGAVLQVLDERRATLTGVGGGFLPNLVSEPARRALVELFSVVTAPDTEPAPWWGPDDDAGAGWPTAPGGTDTTPPATASAGMLTLLPTRADPTGGAVPAGAGRLPLTRRPATSDPEATMARVPDLLATTDHPVLLLMGEVELVGARGPRPSRAVKQCEEYCAWILEHPGRTAVAMIRSLLVAEGTRRSNMSRLRTWLGVSADGDDYLPDAYSGHIRLHPGITTDWEQLRLLISAGVNQSSDDALVEALDLVRGAPLADAAPGQWHWAEELRIEMSSTIRDIGAVLAARALAVNDLDLARWAAARALTAAPEDELLMATRVRTEHLAGNRPEVERLVLHITRQARLLGVDLSDATVTVLQEAMEGRARARRA